MGDDPEDDDAPTDYAPTELGAAEPWAAVPPRESIRRSNVASMRTPLLMAVVAVMAVVSAPPGNARPYCHEERPGKRTASTICQTDGRVSIKAQPGTVKPRNSNGLIPWQSGGTRDYAWPPVVGDGRR